MLWGSYIMRTIRGFLLVVVVFTFLSPLSARAGRRRTEIDPNDTVVTDSKPNIVFIFADDLGWADVGYNGARFYETPNIDKLPQEGMVFNRFYPGGPNCAPSRACILTGTYTPRHRIYTPGGLAKGDLAKMRWKVPSKSNKADASYKTFVSATSIPGTWTSIAEVLKPAGYTCARIGKWHIGDSDLQGFDLSTTNGVPGHVTGSYYSNITVARKMTDTALDFIEQNQDRPFFLFLSHWEVHTALKAEQHIVDKYKAKLASFPDKSFAWKAAYAAEIEVVDRSVGRVRQKLEDLGLTENTLFIFSSDNGGLPSVTPNAPLFAGKGSLFEGGIRTACSMVWPRVIEAGSSCDVPVTGVDLLPSFAELAGGHLPQQQAVDGLSFVPLLTKPDSATDRAIFWHYPLYLSGGTGNKVLPVYGSNDLYWRAVPASAIMKGDWKLIYYYEYENYRLFNLADDIDERQNLAPSHPEKAQALYDELMAWVAETGAPVPTVLNPLHPSYSTNTRR